MDLPRKFTALITPFRDNGRVDYRQMRKNARHQVGNSWAPLVWGTTGESPSIQDHEFLRGLAHIMEEVGDETIVMAGTGTNDTANTVKKTKEAKRAGAHVALVVMPYYNKPEPEGQRKHFLSAAEIMPIVLYDVAGRTGRGIDYKVISELSGHPNVVGYKAATHTIVAIDGKNAPLSELVAEELGSENFRVWSGDDGKTAKLILEHGAYGVISVASNVAPVLVGRMVDMASGCGRAYTPCGPQQRDSTTRVLDYNLSDLFAALFLESNPIPVKAAMNLLADNGHEGMRAGGYRLPMTPPREDTLKALDSVLKGLSLL